MWILKVSSSDEFPRVSYLICKLEFKITSPKQLGNILFNKLAIPYPKKIKDDNYSTSKDILDRLKGTYKIVDLVL